VSAVTIGKGAAVGFIGLGTMGREMAVNLLKAGYGVRAYDVRREAAGELAAEHGAVQASSVADAARGAELVVTMLPDTPQVEEVILGPGGLAENPPAGRLIVDMSTISPQATQRMAAALAERGVALLDAPVSGGPTGATAAKLSIMAGGPAEAFERARPVLAAMGTTIVHVGDSGAGQAVKLCNQLVCAMNIQAICEALALGRAAGLDLGKLREVLLGGAASSWMLENLGPLMLAKDPRAGFRIDLKLKDLRLANEMAFALGVPLPGTALATSLYLEARAHGEGNNGNQALYRVYDRLANQADE
jgi:2-hydroxy-3-oxopropionate reductase